MIKSPIIKKINKNDLLKTFARKTLDKFIIPIISNYCNGNVLEIGALCSPYKKYMKFQKYFVLDINNELADYNMDIHETNLESNKFDTIIATQVLEHLYNPFKAVEEIRRILKPNGYFIASTVFIYPYHGEPNDYFRFTKFGLKKIFEKFNKVKIINLGTPIMAISDLLTIEYKFLKILRPLTSIVKIKNKQNTKIPPRFHNNSKKINCYGK